MSTSVSDDDVYGPIHWILVEYPDGLVGVGGLSVLAEAAAAGTLRILDLESVRACDDGVLSVVTTEQLDAVDLSDFAGASSGLLRDEDLAELAGELAPGSVGAVVMYEELPVAYAVAAWHREGARFVAEGPVEIEELLSALDDAEAKDGVTEVS